MRGVYFADLAYSLGQRCAAFAVGAATRVLFGFTVRHMRTCRWTVRGGLHAALAREEPLIVTAWHQDVLPLFHYLVLRSRFSNRRRWTGLASHSFDGELTERILSPWGFSFVRGSRGKRGALRAVRGLRRALDRGRSVIMIGDGPGPPARRLSPGPVYLARETGVSLYAMRAWARPQWTWPRAWFKPVIPTPHARYVVHGAGPLPVHGDFERARVGAERALNDLCESTDAELYLHSV